MSFRRFIPAILVLLLASCGRDDEFVELSISGRRFQVEVVRTKEAQAKGLMERTSLPESSGMLFVYERDSRLSFWMKNTLIPLSIAFIDSNGVIRDIQDMEPKSLETHVSSMSVRYALEVNQGTFERFGIEVGSKVVFPEGFR